MRNQSDLVEFAKAKDRPGYSVQSHGVSPPPPPASEDRQSGRIVRKEGHGATVKDRKKTLYPVEHRKKFPVVDRKGQTRTRPQAGQMVVLKESAPTGIRGIGVEG